MIDKIKYPLKFEPILKEKIWGGTKLKQLLAKNSTKNNIGESWEISDVDSNISVVSNGLWKGKTLKQLIQTFKGNLVGEKIYKQFGENFPLLIKFIDAKEALSIQLHPNDALAKKRHNSFGKTEMWYVMQADKNANLIVGFKTEINKKQYLNHLNTQTLTDILNIDLVKEGDVYFIPTGRVHAIGAGVLLAEIQQTSDVTYRIYDWNRQDDAGNYRDLHTEEALDALDLTAQKKYKTNYHQNAKGSNKVVACKYFTSNILFLDKEIKIDHTLKSSFVIYMCVSGEGVQFVSDDFEERLLYGETILLPASINKYSIIPIKDSKLLEIYIE